MKLKTSQTVRCSKRFLTAFRALIFLCVSLIFLFSACVALSACKSEQPENQGETPIVTPDGPQDADEEDSSEPDDPTEPEPPIEPDEPTDPDAPTELTEDEKVAFVIAHLSEEEKHNIVGQAILEEVTACVQEDLNKMNLDRIIAIDFKDDKVNVLFHYNYFQNNIHAQIY